MRLCCELPVQRFGFAVATTYLPTAGPEKQAKARRERHQYYYLVCCWAAGDKWQGFALRDYYLKGDIIGSSEGPTRDEEKSRTTTSSTSSSSYYYNNNNNYYYYYYYYYCYYYYYPIDRAE